MALPGDLTTFELRFGGPNGYTDSTGALALVGETGKLFTVDPSTDRPLNVTDVASGHPIIPKRVTVTIGEDGKASVSPLPHSGQATLDPTGWAYRVEWNIASNKPSPGNLTFVVPSGATADFDLLVPAETVPAVAISQPTVASVAGLTGAPTAQQLVDALDVELRAAAVAAVEGADEVTPTGAWDFTGATVTGVAGGGGGSGITPGTAAGQVPVWDGDSWEPATPAEATAADVPFTPTGTIASTNVQAAIAEVAAEAVGGGGGAGAAPTYPTPEGQNLKGWAFDPAIVGSASANPGANILYLTKILTPDSITINDILLVVSVAGVAVSGFEAVIIEPDGTKVATTGDVSAAVNAGIAGSLLSLALTAPVTVGGAGPTDFVYVGLGFSAATTAARFAGLSGSVFANAAQAAGLARGAWRHAQLASTTFPLGASVDLAAQTQNGTPTNIWAAVR